ncbi:MAG: twin-arginine translocase subunit TatC [Dehalococcoidia bacterium]|nr:twin-arginine translocase subunit TatC [Dehalococcoidia bacterium]
MSAESAQRPADIPAVPGEHGGGEMTLMEHLKELRNRVIVCAVAIVLGVIVCAFFWETILGWFLAPAREEIPDFRLVSLTPTDRIATIFKIAMYGGLVLASPVIIYEVMAFVVPGLTPKERNILLPGLLGTIFFLLAGMAFAYWIILPQSMGFLLNIGADEIENQQQIQAYVNFCTRLIFWTGIAFELPMVIAIAAKLGLVRARQLLGFWRYAIIIVFILAAIVTPTPDPVTQTFVAGPLLVLYFVGILFAWTLQPKQPEGTVA